MKRLTLRLSHVSYTRLKFLQLITQYSNHHKKLSLNTIINAIIFKKIKVKNVKIDANIYHKLEQYKDSDKYYERQLRMMDIINIINRERRQITGIAWNFNQITRFIQSHKYDLDYNLFIETNNELKNYYNTIKKALKSCESTQKEVEKLCQWEM